MSALLDRSLIFVTGKGGVGRTTVCAALAMVASERGRRTVVCEVGAHERLPSLFGRPGGHGHEVELAPRLFATTVTPQLALRDYLASQIPGPLVRVLADSRTFQYFYAAAPGARELVTMGAIWDLVCGRVRDRGPEGYDLVVVDAPATGHALGMLRTPRTFVDIARVGPLSSHANRIWDLFTDPGRSGYAAVAAPADMSVNETLDLQERLHRQMGRPLELVIANGVYPRRFSADELERLSALNGSPPVARAVAAAAASQAARVRTQQSQLRRLRRDAEGDVATLPYVFAPEVGLAEVQDLAGALAGRL
jgi:anion-transporting  ArsA/GET3 family ATPase